MPVPVKGNNGFSSGMTTRNENNSTFIQGVWYLVVLYISARIISHEKISRK